MSNARSGVNRVKQLREDCGLSQQELASRAGISRTEISAIECRRTVPSVTTALSLAKVLGVSVESLFSAKAETVAAPEWAAAPPNWEQRHWEAEVRGRVWRYPWEGGRALLHVPETLQWLSTPEGGLPPDSSRNLVLATCDPAAGLLVDELWRNHQIRLIVVTRNSAAALEWVKLGKTHVAGLHLAEAGEAVAHEERIRESLGVAAHLLHLADWDEGLAVAGRVRGNSVSSIARSRIRWVGREAGSGARVCQDQVLEGKRTPQSTASSHWSIAEALCNDWADVGICPRVVSEAAGLRFLPVRKAAYQLCFPADLADDYRLRCLVEVVRSRPFREQLRLLPGISSAQSGSLELIAPPVSPS